jgi:PAS domain S-box-containing protein
MIWQSIILMTIIDALIIVGTLLAILQFKKNFATLKELRATKSVIAMLVGLIVIALFYTADLVTMFVFPLFMPMMKAMTIMKDLHLNLKWIVSLVGVGFIVGGLFHLIKTMLPRIVTTGEKLKDSERQLRAIMDNTVAVVFVKDIEGRYLLVNKRYEALFHISNDNIVGRTDFDVFSEDMARQFQKNDQEILEKGHAIEIEELVPQDDGVHTYISVKFPLRNDTGDIYAVCGIATDITRRKHTEDALQESKAKLNGLYELSPLGIALTDMNGCYLEFNKAFQNICGYSSEELKSLDYWALTPREFEAQEKMQLESLQQTGHYGPYEKAYRRKDSSLIPIRLNGMIVKDQLGQSRIWSIVEDITDSKKAEK